MVLFLLIQKLKKLDFRFGLLKRKHKKKKHEEKLKKEKKNKSVKSKQVTKQTEKDGGRKTNEGRRNRRK